MVGKKGYLKILEAIIAIVLILGLVIYFVPKAEKNLGKIPIELDETAKTILTEAQKDEEFRKCVLGISYPNCLSEKINYILGDGTTWKHAEKICEIDITLTEKKCDYLFDGTNLGSCDEDTTTDAEPCGSSNIIEVTFNNEQLGKLETNVYTKTVTISVPDVTAEPPNPITKDKQLKIFFWSSV